MAAEFKKAIGSFFLTRIGGTRRRLGLEQPRRPAARAYPRRPAGLAAVPHYRTPCAPPGADEPERTTQANRYASLVEAVGLEPRVDDAASDGQAVAAGRRRGPKSRLDLESYLA